MTSTAHFSRAEIVMDCIAIAALALVILCTFVLIARSPSLPFGGPRGGERPCAFSPGCSWR
jgi:hypothetical protein